MEAETKRKYGWKRDLPNNENNFLLTAHPTKLRKFPKKHILNDQGPVFDQGNIGSCTSNALSGGFLYELLKQNSTSTFIPSRLFIYYNERKLEGTVNSDSGAAISDGIKTLTENGVCDETNCPYIIARFTMSPSPLAYKNALDHQILASRRVPCTIEGFKTALMTGLPIVFGFTVYESFESDTVKRTGIMPVPDIKKEECLGGHAVMACGWENLMTGPDGTKGYFKVKNSWGKSWGQGGYFFFPFEVLRMGLCADAWVISQLEDPIVANRQMSTNAYFIGRKVEEIYKTVKDKLKF